MSNEKQETTDDIVEMLRANARGDRFDDFSFTSLADRIEAAVKREATCEKSAHVGNAAAMREALEQIHELLGIGGKPDTSMCIRYEAAYQIAKEALSAPPRNCDVGTAE